MDVLPSTILSLLQIMMAAHEVPLHKWSSESVLWPYRRMGIQQVPHRLGKVLEYDGCKFVAHRQYSWIILKFCATYSYYSLDRPIKVFSFFNLHSFDTVGPLFSADISEKYLICRILNRQFSASIYPSCVRVPVYFLLLLQFILNLKMIATILISLRKLVTSSILSKKLESAVEVKINLEGVLISAE